MSIIITNITDQDMPENGLGRYVVRINHKVICKFEHERKINGLAQCLRDAANAVEESREKEITDNLILFQRMCD